VRDAVIGTESLQRGAVMFRFTAQFVQRFWLGLLLAWIAVLAAVWWQAPAWDAVAEEGEFKFLPPTARPDAAKTC
jgi:hypothetical protein